MRVPKHLLIPAGFVGMLGLAGCVVQVAPPVAPPASVASVEASAPPPPLPVYAQPPCPAEGYIWTPGYWAYSAAGYYWVPGTWVRPPVAGLLWTPGYWAMAGGSFQWHEGYWGTHVGYYGGINYGFGYGGSGYEGGRWENGHFAYNTTVNNVNRTTVHNTYVKNVTIVNNVTNVTNVSYNGGPGGTAARPSEADLTYAREAHRPPTADQAQHLRAAAAEPAFRAAENHGRPAVAATARPAEFKGPGVVGPREAPEGRGPEKHPAEVEQPKRGFAAQGAPGQDHAAPQANIGAAHQDKPAPNARPPVQPASGHPASPPKPPAAEQKKPEHKKAEEKN